MPRQDRERYAAVSAEPAAADRVADILQAACRVVLSDGAHGLRMAAVANEADVSKALVHYYFPTRQELLRAAFAYSAEQWDLAVAASLERIGSGRRRVEKFLLASIDPTEPFGRNRALWNEVWSSLRMDEDLRPLVNDTYRAWVEQLTRLVEGARGDGTPSSELSPRASAWRLAALVDGLDSMLYLGLVEHARARRLLREALEKELGP